ncbi:MAG: EamA family transporter [Candidatus Doudnabacteria bacterium]|nr:EamA family transporter [Candidatus Doudnabacteria bacterium]
MRVYIVFAILAYFAFALNSVIDKFLLKKTVREPTTYAFYIGLLSGVAIFLFPFGLDLPSGKILVLALASGALFEFALIDFFRSLKLEDTTKVLPAMGALVPLMTFILSAVIVGERLSGRELLGLGVLVAGTLVLSARSSLTKHHYRWLGHVALAAALFAMSFTLAKAVYLEQSFISGLIWTRLGMVAAALAILVFPRARSEIFHTTLNIPAGSKALFLSGQLLAAGGGILQNYAVSIGSVTLVNALQSTQFAFLILLSWFFSTFFPHILDEDFSTKSVASKVTALIIIGWGLWLIS